MKNLLLLTIFCVIIFACQQKTTKENTTKPHQEEIVQLIDPKQPVPIKKKNKPIIKTINGVGTDGDSLKVLIYRYLDSTNNQYLRDFDILNNKDSVVFSGMEEELHEEGQRSEDNYINIDMIPVYFISDTFSMTIKMGLYINELENGTQHCISIAIKEYFYNDNIMHLLDLTIMNNGIKTIERKFVPVSAKLTIDSLYSLSNDIKKKEYFWVKCALSKHSLNLFLNDSITMEEAISLYPKNLSTSGDDCETYTPQYFFKIIKYHYY